MVFRKKTATPSSLEPRDTDKLITHKRRGLFGRKSNDDRSSDSEGGPIEKKTPAAFQNKMNITFKRRAERPEANPEKNAFGGGKPRALSPFKRRMQKDEKEPATPPITPEKEPENDTPLQVKVVTVKSSPSPAHGKDGKNASDDDSIMSDLTDNRTYKRLVDFKQNLAREQEEAAAKAAVKAEAGMRNTQMPSIPEDKIASVKARLEKVQAAQLVQGDAENTIHSDHTQQPAGKEPVQDGKNDLNPVTYILSYMEHACSSSPAAVPLSKSYSFVPEWGMAPSTDERDRGGLSQPGGDDDDDDIANDGTDLTQSLVASKQNPGFVPSSSNNDFPKDEVHENFEMVLEDLQSTEDRLAIKRQQEILHQQQQQQQQRNWMGAMSFRKNQASGSPYPQLLADGQVGVQNDHSGDENRDLVLGSAAMNTKSDNMPPHTVEEEKKEDDSSAPSSTAKEGGVGGGARKMGSKLLKSFRRLKRNKAELPPVSEEDELESPTESSELEVRVPFNKKRLTEKDLIGDNVVQDIYRDLEASLESTVSQSPETVPTHHESQQDTHESSYVLNPHDRPSSPMSQSTKTETIDEEDRTAEAEPEPEPEGSNMITSIMSLLSPKELPEELRDLPDRANIPKSKSWVDQFRLTMSEDSTGDTDPNLMQRKQAAMDRQRSAPTAEQPIKKQFWRSAEDPKTGRTYYYHRVTREVTWKKPQEVIDAEAEEKNTIETGNEREDDRRLLSVLSDGDLAAAAETNPEQNGALRKKNARDFDPRVWAIKEQVVKLLETMAPPDGSSVEQILQQYEGREELLLRQLLDMKEARPFDEPVASDTCSEDEMEVSKPKGKPPSGKKESARSKSIPRRLLERAQKALPSDPKEAADPKRDGTKRNEHKRASPIKVETKKSEPSGVKATAKLRDAKMEATISAVKAVVEAEALESKETSTSQTPRKERATKPDPDGIELEGKDNAAELNFSSETRNSHDFHSPAPLGSRVRTSGSGVTKVSEKTELIKNTSKGRNVLNTVGEVRSIASDATSLSSTGLEPRAKTTALNKSPGPIPGKISAPRTRELMVEEFSSTERSYTAETFEKKRNVRAGRFGTTAPRQRRKPFTTPITPFNGGDESTRDSVSALSVPAADVSDGNEAGIKDSRRKALDEAIAREDWDLATAISKAMRTLKTKTHSQPQKKEGWKQSELDLFISQNDWDAVANYIAHVRAKTKQDTEPRAQQSRGVTSRTRELVSAKKSSRRKARSISPSKVLYDEEDEIMGNPKKRFGAKSQLQHNEIQSESSWESEDSSYYSDDYSSVSSFSETSARRRNKNRYRYASKHSLPIPSASRANKPKEFTC